jgi:curved DNA-binding protein CbpA
VVGEALVDLFAGFYNGTAERRKLLTGKNSYYEILKVRRNAQPDDIKSSFKKLALEFHPDRNRSPEAETRFKIISDAYQVLSDPAQRKVYDSFLKNSRAGKRFAKTAGSGTTAPVLDSAETIFDQINVFLWDLEDFLRDTVPDRLNTLYSGKPLWYYVMRIMEFMETWFLAPPVNRGYMAGVRSRSKVQLMNFFYYLRIKIDKLFRELTFEDLLKPLPRHGIPRIDCILEIQRHTFHYLNYIRLVELGESDSTPGYLFSRKEFENTFSS